MQTYVKRDKFARATKRTLEWVIYNLKGSRWRLVTIDLRHRFTFEIVHVLRFGNELTSNFAADLSSQIFNNH